ncbi:hypothetical protein GGI02_000446 [Coemansia sp. RSA 2322]|nr:hypothetical protein GGI02_000446 [Coemansia sp. RSA 2322]
MVTARNALALSTVCAFVVASLALWRQPRRGSLLRRTVGHVLEAGFGGHGASSDCWWGGKPLLPRFVRRLFHTQLPQFATNKEIDMSHGPSPAAEEVTHAPETLDSAAYLRSSQDNGPATEKERVERHIGGGAKRRRRWHRGRRGDMRAVDCVARFRQRPRERGVQADVAIGSGGSTLAASVDRSMEPGGRCSWVAADPVVDVTEPRRYRPTPIGQQRTSSSALSAEDDGGGSGIVVQAGAADSGFSLFSSEAFP